MGTAYEFVWDQGSVLDLFQGEADMGMGELLDDMALLEPPELELEGLLFAGPPTSE